MQIMAIRSEMSKNEDQLRDYKRYRAFLDKLTPTEWFVEHPRKTKPAATTALSSATASKKKSAASARAAAAAAASTTGGGEEERPGTADEAALGDNMEDDEDFASDEEIEEAEVYFKQPQQLMNIFAELEESNLSLIQSCQETEETLEELKKNIEDTEAKM